MTRVLLLSLTAALVSLNAQPSRLWVITEQFGGSRSPVELHFTPTRDGVYTPIALRKPPGEGPFPAVLFFAGNGGGGMATARNGLRARDYAPRRFLEAGYVVGWLRYRAEVRNAYRGAEPLPEKGRVLPRSPLDHDDLISIIDYVKKLAFVDPERVGLAGSSHGGELILKAASETTFAAGALLEPAAVEYLAIAMEKLPRGEPQLQDKRKAMELADKAEAMERIGRIQAPLLVVGRDSDHLQGVFKLTYEWLAEAGKQVEWASYDHPRHGFALPRDVRDDGSGPDEIQKAAVERMLAFFAKRMKR